MRFHFLLFFSFTFLLANGNPALSPQEKHYIQEHKTLKVCTNPSLMPFEVLTHEGKHEGIAAEFLSLIAQRLGFHLTIIQTYTWEESLEKMRQNACDIVSFVPQSTELAPWLIFTDPLFVDKNVIITASNHRYIGDLQANATGTIVLPRGLPLIQKIESNYPHLTLFTVDSESDALTSVANQQMDMTIRPFALVAYQIKQQGFFNLKIAGSVEGVDTVFRLGVTHDDTLLRDILNKGIRTITLHEKETIVNRYIPSIIQQTPHKEIGYALIFLGIVVSLVLLWNAMLRKEVKKATAKNIENEKIIMQQAKKAELGELIGNISHQWREPLSSLNGTNLMLIGLMEHHQEITQPFLYQQLKKAEKTLEFMSQTMQNFLEFYKPSILMQHFSIYESIEQTLSLVETSLLESHVKVVIEGDKEQTLYGIKNEYMHVWLNLINNAIHAFAHYHGSDRQIKITIFKDEILFCDNARGKIYTSDLSKGVGFPMCKKILSKYHQSIIFQNLKDGVCIRIYLLKS